MSISLMAAVWRRTDLGTHDKMVLLALADHANADNARKPSETNSPRFVPMFRSYSSSLPIWEAASDD